MENLMANINLTKLEKELLTFYIGELYAEPGFSDVGVRDLAQGIKKSIKSTNGVVSSLIKKNIITVQEVGADCPIVYLNPQYYFLHPEWKDDDIYSISEYHFDESFKGLTYEQAAKKQGLLK